MKNILICALMLFPFAAYANSSSFASKIAALESDSKAHIGIAALNTANGQRLAYRANERFAMCSTHKLLLVAAILSRVDAGTEKLEREISFSQADVQSYAPIIKQHLAEGKMRVRDLSAAALQYSDNSAANLLLDAIGGPEAFNHYVQSLGDSVTRLDRNEPTLNTNLPNDPRDTTTPLAMVDSMHKLLIGTALSNASRTQLISWLVGNMTGDKKLRAGINPVWKIGDKTGSGENGASNDVAIVWPTERKPFLIAVYTTGMKSSLEQQSAVIAEAGHIVSNALYPQ